MPNTVQLTQNGQPVFPATDATVVTGLATVATSGSYNDLTNKPTIDTTPTAASSNLVTSGGVKSYVDNTVGDIQTLLAAI